MKSLCARVVILFVFVFAFASFCSAAELPPLSPTWRGAAYQGLVAKLRPRNPSKMKFIFLGDPIPCTMRNGTNGYGGFVRMKKHTFLWMHSAQTYFYQVNADGALCTLIAENNMEESTVSPQMVDVRMVEREVWVPDETRSEYVYNHEKSDWEWEDVVVNPAHYETVTVREVYPILPQYELSRQAAFDRANFKMLPICQ